ncbi:MAG: hypothetical protein IPQ02_02865 [Saprospiraceae bacterium]|nr:hypothetical protein [Candidatus Defluviibacterium haderslevense]
MFSFSEHRKELNNWLNESAKESYLQAFWGCKKKHPKITMDEFYESEITLQNQEIKILENLGSLEFDQIAILNKRKKLVSFYQMVRTRNNAHLLILIQEYWKIIYSQWIELLKSFPNDYLYTTVPTKQIQDVDTLADIELKSNKYLALFEHDLKDEFIEHEFIRFMNVFKHGIESLCIDFKDLKYNDLIKNNVKASVIFTKDDIQYTIPSKTAYSFNWKEFYAKIKRQDFDFGYGLGTGEMVAYIIGLVKFATKLVELKPDLFDLVDLNEDKDSNNSLNKPLINQESENNFTLSTIEDWLFEFKERMTANDYKILVSALLEYIETGKFPKPTKSIQINGRLNKKLFGWALNRIFEAQGKGIEKELLIFAKQYISLFGSTQFDESNFLQSNLYKYFTTKTK